MTRRDVPPPTRLSPTAPAPGIVAPPAAAAPWAALREARAHDPARRVPWTVGGVAAGAVACVHLRLLRRWPQWLRVVDGRDGVGGGSDGVDAGRASRGEAAGEGDGAGHGDDRRGAVDLHAAAAQRDAALAAVNAALRDAGVVTGWRDERVAVPALEGGGELARVERAAARFWGSGTRGAHANGVVADRDGRPAALWVAQRSTRKAVDPGCWDNLVGGGVPAGQSSWQALVREAGEEAGLGDGDWRAAVPGRAVTVLRDRADGLQRERIDSWDLWLPRRWRPRNRDGEVQRFECLAPVDALALAAAGAMTVDAALVTLDFGLRHGLLAPPPGSDAVFGTPAAGPP